MNSYPYPDFSEQGYQVIRELGRNREGGRITWLASDVNTEQQVVLKQFCFAQVGSSWSGFEAHQREIKILQKLAHPGIPRYISSFATSDGFCLVQEYINAQSLAERVGDFKVEEIKQIAVKALEIITYLQNFNPPVIHRDIKPENILVNEEINVYLIDFGFARIGSQEVAGSSVFKGTPGFIPPEQMFEPTKATDLYALGTTLICMLTGIKSTAIRQLCDRNNPYIIKFRPLLPQLSLRFIGWLENMVQPEQDKRFANAQSALAALQPLDVKRIPGVDFSETTLQFTANQIAEKLTQSITLKNSIPDTLLQGRWEVAPHPHDPPHTPDSHAWISVTPAEFNGNHTWCQVEVDTSKLMADQQYKRQLILHSNAYPATHTLTVKVQTAALPIETTEVPYAWLAGLLLVCIIASASMTWSISVAGLWAVMAGIIGAVVGAVVGSVVGRFIGAIIGAILDVIFISYNFFSSRMMNVTMIGGLVVGLIFGAVLWSRNVDNDNKIGIVLIWILLITFIVLSAWSAFRAISYKTYPYTSRDNWNSNYNQISCAMLSLLTAGLGTSLGIIYIIGFANAYILFTLAGTGLPLISILFFSPIKRHRLIAKYRQSEVSLIKP